MLFFQMTNKVKTSINKVVDDTDSWENLSLASGLSDDYDYLTEVLGQDEEAAFTTDNTSGFADDDTESVVSSIMGDRPKRLVGVL